MEASGNLHVVDRNVLSERAYHQLRNSILRGRTRPGTKLIVRILAEEMGLSPTPIKAALTSLEAEGLVESVPYKGFFVPRFTRQDVDEIYTLREVLEGLAAYLTTLRATEEIVLDLGKSLELQHASIESDNLEAYGDHDIAFHKILVKASGNSRLIQVLDSIQGQIRLMVGSSIRGPRRFQQVLQEHKVILQAVKDTDGKRAEVAMRTHIRNVREALMAHVQNFDLESSSDGTDE